ncbi:porin family protein [Ekhidna sp.]|uniref:porin family protein n=1 Tax=Ekhidna sp. TaxID=2608089 RepID=UPI0032EB74E3
MKKTLLTLSLALFSVVAFSQASIGIGLKGGANFANASGDNLNADGITSYHVGAYGLIKLTNIGIQPELLFSKQGANVDGNDIDLSYVNIPVMLKFYLPAGLNLQAGPQFGMLTNAKDGDGDDIKESFKNSDLSAALGAGWDAPFGLQVGARYVFSLSDNGDSIDDPTFEYKNKTFQIYLGYSLFKLGN